MNYICLYSTHILLEYYIYIYIYIYRYRAFKHWLRIELGQWPQNIKELCVYCKITVDYGIKSYCKQIEKWDGTPFTLRAQYYPLEFPLVNQYPTSITVETMVAKIFSKDDPWCHINESKWDEYGIIMNNRRDYV